MRIECTNTLPATTFPDASASSAVILWAWLFWQPTPVLAPFWAWLYVCCWEGSRAPLPIGPGFLFTSGVGSAVWYSLSSWMNNYLLSDCWIHMLDIARSLFDNCVICVWASGNTYILPIEGEIGMVAWPMGHRQIWLYFLCPLVGTAASLTCSVYVSCLFFPVPVLYYQPWRGIGSIFS